MLRKIVRVDTIQTILPAGLRFFRNVEATIFWTFFSYKKLGLKERNFKR